MEGMMDLAVEREGVGEGEVLAHIWMRRRIRGLKVRRYSVEELAERLEAWVDHSEHDERDAVGYFLTWLSETE